MFDPKEVLALCEKATPGPWQIIEQGKLGRFVLDGNNEYALEMDYLENDNFVVMARDALPEFAERIIKLDKEVEAALGRINVLAAVAEAAEKLLQERPPCPHCDGFAHPKECICEPWDLLHGALTAAGYGGEE